MWSTHTPQEYEAKHLAMCTAARISPWESVRPVVAHVSEGRWVGDCPHCRNGIPLHRDWPTARCAECGGVFPHVQWPDAFDEIEAVLAVRPMANQNWTDPETVERLVVDNIRHGLAPKVVD